MEKLYTVGETAKLVKMTTETLRHYDRIGLIKPCKIDEMTNYRYYSDHEIVHLNTIQALRCMELPLEKIKAILAYNDFNQIIKAFKQAEQTANDKIMAINHAKKKIATARAFYESKLANINETSGSFIKTIPERVILITKALKSPSLDNLWNYHRHFYSLIDPSMKEDFIFEDLAGIYQADDKSRMFAVCTKYV